MPSSDPQTSMVRLAVLEERMSAFLDREEETARRTDTKLAELKEDIKDLSRKLGALSDQWKTARTAGRAYMSVALAIGGLFGWLGFPKVLEWLSSLFGSAGR